LNIEDSIECLLPFLAQSTDRWAQRWTLVIGEITRRGDLMGWEAAVASVRDELEAGRL
jgi:hypothetical protein